MRKIVVYTSVGNGTDSYTGYLVDDSVPDDELDAFAYESALDLSESYDLGIPNDLDEFEYIDYLHGIIEYAWYEYDPKLHDRHLITGNNTQVYWERY